MSDLLRTFIAMDIKPSPALIQVINDLQNKLSGEPAKWVNPAGLHLTLKFLGDTLPSQVDEVGEELNQLSGMFSSFSFQLEGLGYFKSKGMPRVLFANIKGGEELQLLTAGINNRLTKLGFEPEPRPFKPHLTLGRIKFLKNRKAFYEVVEKYRESFFQNVSVNEVIFYRSILKFEGPEYRKLENFRFL